MTQKKILRLYADYMGKVEPTEDCIWPDKLTQIQINFIQEKFVEKKKYDDLRSGVLMALDFMSESNKMVEKLHTLLKKGENSNG